MLEACRGQGKLKLQFLRGPFSADSFAQSHSSLQMQEFTQPVEKELANQEEEEAKVKQKIAQEEARRRRVMSSGAADIQRLLAERFAKILSTCGR